MLLTRFNVSIFSVGTMVLSVGVVCGQPYPNKPIRIITGDVGSGLDFTSRLIAQGLTTSLGQPVIVENRGGSVVTAAELVARALPDGYTLILHGSNIWLTPFLQDNVPYDPLRDFSPITLAVSAPNILVVNPSLAAKSVKELIALAKAKPGALNYASASTGSTNHLSAELFKSMAGVNLVRINYKGASAALNDLIGGQVQLMFGSAAATALQVKTGRLRALAVTSAQPSTLLPGMPTVASSGLPGYESVSMYAMFAPGNTPAARISRLNGDVVQLLSQPDVKEKFFDSGVETVGSSPEQFAVKMKSEMARMGKVIKDAGIRAD